MMKRFGFSQGVKQQMRKQISNVLLITILILIISIGMFVQKSIFYGRLLFVVFLAGIAITVFTVRKVRNIDSLYYVAADKKYIEINSNVNRYGRKIYYTDIEGVYTEKKDLLIIARGKKYKIIYGYLENEDFNQVKSLLSMYIS